MMKKTLWIGTASLFFLAAVVLVVPAFIDVGYFKSTYLPLIESAIQRKVNVGEVRLRLLPAPSIRLSTLRISDTGAFPDNTLFAAEQLQLRLKLWPLLRGRFEITELILDEPAVNLLKQPDGSFNASDIAGGKLPRAKKGEASKSPAPSGAENSVFPLFVPTRVRIRDGRFNLETKGQKPVRIDGVDLVLEEFSADRPFRYRASFNYAGLKTVSLEGTLEYREPEAALRIDNNRLRVGGLSLPVNGAISRLAAVPRVDLTLAGKRIPAKPLFEILAVFGLAPPDTEVSGPVDLLLTVNGPSNRLVTQVRGAFHNVKIDGRRAVKGTLNGNVLLKLPLGSGDVSQRLEGDGKLVAHNGELTNVDMIAKIQKVTGMIGMSKRQRREVTTFKTLESEFVIGGGRADFKRVYLVNPQIEVNGQGNMTLKRPVLDMRLDAALSSTVTAQSSAAGSVVFLKDNAGRLVVPLKVTGRLENPAVNLDSEKALARGLGTRAEKGLGSFFKKFFR
jgi:uncharacterized protein involved in outer membrane biogenesis